MADRKRYPLVKVHTGNPSQPLAEYTYNGDGEQVKNVVNGQTRYYVHDYYETERPDALALSVQQTTSLPNAYTYRTIDNTSSYTIQAGDVLEYDIYLDSANPQYRGGLDALLSASGTVRDHTGWVDQNGYGVHPGTILPAQAQGGWYHRAFSIGSKAGETLSTFKIAHEGDAAGFYVILLDNIRITNGGQVRQVIYSDGFAAVSLQAEGPTPNVDFQSLQRGTSYYRAGAAQVAARVALRRSGVAGGNGVKLILTDHLGSTRAITDPSGVQQYAAWYAPWGSIRSESGSPFTDYAFQGQRDAGWGLLNFKARWLDSRLGRFAQADSIIPGAGNPMAWDRYSGLGNNPINYTDPSGHKFVEDEDTRTENVEILSSKGKEIYKLYDTWKEVYGDLSEQMFFGWMMAYEMNGLQDVGFSLDGKSMTVLDIIKEVVTRQLFGDSLKAGGHMPYCYSSSCTAGLFNFLAKYVQVARDRAKQDLPLSPLDYPAGYQKENPVEMLHDKLLTDAASFTNDVLNASPASKTYGNDLPYHWGNDEKWGVGRASGTTNSSGLIYRNGTFLIFTANQGPKK